MKKISVLVVCAVGCALLAACSAKPSVQANAAAAAATSAAPTSYATDVNGQTCVTSLMSSAGYCPGDAPSPDQTDPSGQTCPTLDSAGYCPGDDPSPDQTDPSGQTCPTLDSAGYCPGDDPSPAMTAEQQQAVDAAQNYLALGQGFSYEGLLNQLTSSAGNGFPEADAKFAISYLKPDWDQQAVEAAKNYLALGMGFSRASLLQQLTSSYGSGFTWAQATYAVNKVMPS